MIHATSNRDEGGVCSNDVILRGGGFLVFGIVTALAVTEPPALLADGDHYREMASRLRGLGRLNRKISNSRNSIADHAGSTSVILYRNNIM